jgi:hypothetical protein
MSPPLEPAVMGPIFEMRTYHYHSGELPVIVETWADAIEVPLRFGPVCAVWYCELGELNRFVHIWPYSSLDHRAENRSRAHATGLWPPYKKAVLKGGRDYRMVSQENKILMPAAFSPIR